MNLSRKFQKMLNFPIAAGGLLHICLFQSLNIYRSFATRVSQLKIWHFCFTGIERNVCRCTLNRYSVITQCAKLAAGEQFGYRCTHRNYSTSKVLNSLLKNHTFWVVTLLSQMSNMIFGLRLTRYIFYIRRVFTSSWWRDQTIISKHVIFIYLKYLHTKMVKRGRETMHAPNCVHSSWNTNSQKGTDVLKLLPYLVVKCFLSKHHLLIVTYNVTFTVNNMIESKIINKTHKMFKFSSMFRENPESHSRNVVWKKILLIYAQFSCKHLPEYTVSPNVAVEGLALLHRLWEVPYSVHC